MAKKQEKVPLNVNTCCFEKASGELCVLCELYWDIKPAFVLKSSR